MVLPLQPILLELQLTRDDDYNGKWFGVNAAGVKIDVSVSGDEEYDRSWDAVWDVAVDVNENGYTAELCYHFLYFNLKIRKTKCGVYLSTDIFIKPRRSDMAWTSKIKRRNRLNFWCITRHK